MRLGRRSQNVLHSALVVSSHMLDQGLMVDKLLLPADCPTMQTTVLPHVRHAHIMIGCAT